MAELIEHIDTKNLEYFAQEFHKEILTHIKMTNPAQDYWQEQYNKLFSTVYTHSVTLVATPSTISPKDLETESQEVVLTATFKCTKTTNTPDGATTSTPTIDSITDLSEDWTQLNVTQATKTITVSDFTKDVVESITGTINLLEPYEEGSTHNSNIVTNSTKITIVKPNMWCNNILSLDADSFNSNYKNFSTFTTGKNKEFQSVTGFPLTFLSTSGSLNFEQSGNSIILEKKSITTDLGTYYAYITGKSNGSIWNSVTIS